MKRVFTRRKFGGFEGCGTTFKSPKNFLFSTTLIIMATQEIWKSTERKYAKLSISLSELPEEI
jgi:hypothetical protein